MGDRMEYNSFVGGVVGDMIGYNGKWHKAY